MKRNTSRSGLPFWGPLELWQSLAQRTLARSVLIKTFRLGSRFVQATGDSKVSNFPDLVFNTYSEVRGITEGKVKSKVKVKLEEDKLPRTTASMPCTVDKSMKMCPML